MKSQFLYLFDGESFFLIFFLLSLVDFQCSAVDTLFWRYHDTYD